MKGWTPAKKCFDFSQPFKGRYSGHRTTMNNSNFRDMGSTLSKFIWELKDEGVNFQIKWRIVDRSPPYNPRTRKCMPII